MKSKLLLLALLALIAGCAHFPVATRTVAYPSTLKPGEVIELAIESARDVKFPPATKIDKANGLVEFGNFAMPEIGTTAQLRVKSETEIEITVKRGSVYVPLGVDQQADDFRTHFTERLRKAGAK